MKNILITGGCGFIGLNLINFFLRNFEFNIRVLDNLLIGSIDDLKHIENVEEINHGNIFFKKRKIQFLKGDITNGRICDQATKNIDCVVHLAANTGVEQSIKNPFDDLNTNIIGTYNLLNYSKLNNIKKFIFASSGAVIGDTNNPINENKPHNTKSPYGASKLSGEGYCKAFFGTYGLNTTILRFSNVYGPRSKKKTSVVANFFKDAIKNGTINIFGDGTQTRDFIYVKDLCEGIFLAINYSKGGQIFQIATQKQTSIKNLAKEIKKIIKKDNKNVIKINYKKKRDGDVLLNYARITKAKKELLFNPKINIKKGLDYTYKYYKELLK